MAIDGVYKVEIESPMGNQEITLTLKTDGNKLSGSTESSFGKADFTDGTVNGDEFNFKMKISGPGGDMVIEYTGRVSGNEVSGSAKMGDFGSVTYKGKKV
jgi:hypothetical protein